MTMTENREICGSVQLPRGDPAPPSYGTLGRGIWCQHWLSRSEAGASRVMNLGGSTGISQQTCMSKHLGLPIQIPCSGLRSGGYPPEVKSTMLRVSELKTE